MNINLELKHKIIIEFITSIVLIVFYTGLFLNIDTLVEQSVFSSFDSQLFPKVIILCLITLSSVLCLDCFRMWNNHKKDKITHYMRTLIDGESEEYPLGRMFIYLVILFVYFLAFHYLGFVYSTPVIMLCTSYLLGMKNLLLGAVFAIIFTLFLDYASLHFLQIILPSGELFS